MASGHDFDVESLEKHIKYFGTFSGFFWDLGKNKELLK
jgi:hypothetical protein